MPEKKVFNGQEYSVADSFGVKTLTAICDLTNVEVGRYYAFG